MSTAYLPFLYQTRTLQRACRVPLAAYFSQSRQLTTGGRNGRGKPSGSIKSDNSIPFQWDETSHDVLENASDEPADASTITPTEAEIFKGIFEDIAKGKVQVKTKKGSAPEPQTKSLLDAMKQGSATTQAGGSIIDQARDTKYRQQFLERYPPSLRKAAEMALGRFELEPQPQRTRMRAEMPELEEIEAEKLAAWSRYEEIRNKEKQRVEALMGWAQEDTELWDIMEREVFSLPKKLGIYQPPLPSTPPKPKRGRKSKARTAQSSSESQPEASAEGQIEASSEEEILSMDVHGPLYPHYLSLGLSLLDSAFKRPSPLAFQVLPRVKDLGLQSYVLGVSTPLYSKLAQMCWNRFGDANAALDVIQEMNSLGLPPDEQVADLLTQMRDDLHACTWGAQGPFVMAMMESAPYDAALRKRLDHLGASVMRSVAQNAAPPPSS